MVQIQTVRGLMPPEALGITMSHEHLLVDFTYNWERPTEASLIKYIDKPVSMELLGMLRKGTYGNTFSLKDNRVLCDVDDSINELKKFKFIGGKSIVEVTPKGMGRDPLALKKISEETSVNIICATGWYVEGSHPTYVKDSTVDELQEILVREIIDGIGRTGIKAGIIKCACTFPIKDCERKVLQAAAKAQRDTGASFTFHPGYLDTEEKIIGKEIYKNIEYARKDVFKKLDIIQREGADLNKVYVSHVDGGLLATKDWTLPIEFHKSLIDKYGVTLSFDNLGINNYSVFPYIHGSDRKRVAILVELCKQGYDKYILLSQDIATKTGLTKYGGYGYAHVLENIIPELEVRGVNKKQIDNMLIENPKRILAFS